MAEAFQLQPCSCGCGGLAESAGTRTFWIYEVAAGVLGLYRCHHAGDLIDRFIDMDDAQDGAQAIIDRLEQARAAIMGE